MSLSSEAQALFDHAKNSLPRWLTSGANTMLEWLYSYTDIFDAARTQAQTWVDNTYLDNSTGTDLDQHAADRGTSRRSGESDDALRARLKNITDAVTEPALKAAIDHYLIGALGGDKLVKVDGHYPDSAAKMKTAMAGYGDFTDGSAWLFDEATGDPKNLFGDVTLKGFNSPAHGINGPLGAGDYAVGLSSVSTNFTAQGDSTQLDIGPNDDLLFVWVGRFTSAPVTFGAMFQKADASFSSGWAITGTAGSEFNFYIQGSGSRITSHLGANYLPGEWHVGIAARDCAKGVMRAAIMGVTSGTQFIGDYQACPVDSYSAVSKFAVGSGGWTSANNTFQCAAVYAVSGPDKAGDVPDNISGILTYLRDAIFVHNGGLNSTYQLSGDGYIEVVMGPSPRISFGLAPVNAATGRDDGYRFEPVEGSDIWVRELGVDKGAKSTWAQGDVFRVRRTGSTITYEKGNTVVYTSLTPSFGPLVADFSFLNLGSYYTGVKMFDGTTNSFVDIEWENKINVAAGPCAIVNLRRDRAHCQNSIATPYISSSFLSRGFRMTNANRPMGYVVILPYGSSTANAKAVSEIIRQLGPGGYYAIVETRANP